MAQASRERRRARQPQRELEDAGDTAKDQIEERSGGEDRGPIAELKGVMSDAAVSVLSPVAKKLATQAAKMAIERGPELLEDTILPKIQDLGDRAGGLFGGGDDEEDGGGGRAGDGTGKGRRMPIQQAVDVAAPLDVVYDQFTQFEDFPKFMHRAQRVEQRDETHVVFHEKMWGVSRQWEAEIVEQVPDERIVWRTTSGMQHVGVVTFHDLAERLTRIELNLDIDPEGPLEKIARGARFAKRAARADLKRFKAFVEMRDDETGAWRGRIEDSEVVDDDEERYEDEEEPEAYEDEDEPEAYEEEEEPERDEEEERQDDDEDDEEPSRRATAKSKANGGRAKQRSTSSSASKSKPKTRATSKSRAKPKSTNGRRTTRAKASSGKRSG
jgi:uncharacterized membrane protein